jgi:hypothetical protein
LNRQQWQPEIVVVPRYRRGRLPLQACRNGALPALPPSGGNVKINLSKPVALSNLHTVHSSLFSDKW